MPSRTKTRPFKTKRNASRNSRSASRRTYGGPRRRPPETLAVPGGWNCACSARKQRPHTRLGSATSGPTISPRSSTKRVTPSEGPPRRRKESPGWQLATRDTLNETLIVGTNTNLMKPIYEYLADGTLPTDTDAVRRLQLQSGQYTIINKQLYKRGFSLPYLRCVTLDDGHEIL
ncbi:unnamed protein product [Prunus armeniaca]|uniref:Uncharacterized protein n=1 Tax=Prunus armeniaca TaxID=36596 RepID=A0A6J5WVX1_PRUAR|nr:unnamed protein product [Prunus armeniaca]